MSDEAHVPLDVWVRELQRLRKLRTLMPEVLAQLEAMHVERTWRHSRDAEIRATIAKLKVAMS